MSGKSYKWFLSTLFITLAVAFGFWLGVSVLNWYSDREIDSDKTRNFRPVSILSGEERSKVKENLGESIDGELTTADSIFQDEDSIHLDSLNFLDSNGIDSLSYLANDGHNNFYEDSISNISSLGDYHFIKRDRDQMIATISFSLPGNIRQQSETTLQLDAVLGGQPDEPTLEDMVIVELWKSPLKFRGYKFSNNVLVVYDLTQVETLSLYYSEGKLYLGYLEVFYQISPTTQFKPLIPTTNAILNDN